MFFSAIEIFIVGIQCMSLLKPFVQSDMRCYHENNEKKPQGMQTSVIRGSVKWEFLHTYIDGRNRDRPG